MFGHESKIVDLGYRTLVLDISDLISYLFHHRHPSGIQRVQCNIVENIVNASNYYHFNDIRFSVINEFSSSVDELDIEGLIELVRLTKAESTTHENVRKCLAEIQRDLHPIRFDDRSVYVVTGAFWNFPNYIQIYRKIKAGGAAIGCLLYDLIPITNPEFCAAPLVHAFRRSLMRSLPYYDFIITISDHTAREAAKFIRENQPTRVVIKPLPLAHYIENTNPDHTPVSYRREVDIPPFVLCVGTIEVRKNHIYIFNAWKMLLSEKKVAVPKLVIVGRWGWRVADFREQLEATDYLNGHIIVLNEVDDQTLSWLYANCRFTIFASYVEGWGLPVGESIAHGRVCLASQNSSIPEVAADFAIYLDPYSVSDGKKTIEKVLMNPGFIDEVEKRILTEFEFRTWPQYTENFISSISEIITHPKFVSSTPRRARVALDSVVIFDESHDSNSVKSFAELMNIDSIMDDCWYGSESIGRWMNGNAGSISFDILDCSSGNVELEMALVTSPWVQQNSLEITANLTKNNYEIQPSTRFIVNLCALVKESCLKVQFNVSGEIDKLIDQRGIAVGLFAMRVKSHHMSPSLALLLDEPYSECFVSKNLS